MRILRRAILLLSCIALALPCLAQKTQIQFQQAGSNVYFGTGYFKFNFASGFTVTNVGGVLTVTTAGGGVPYPAGSGIVQVAAGAAWGSTLSLSGTGNVAMTTNPVFTTPNLGVPSAIDLTHATNPPVWNQSTTGTASNLSGTPALPNGTTATTQTVGDNTTKIATDAFVLANASGTGLPTVVVYVPVGSNSAAIQTYLTNAVPGEELWFSGTNTGCSLTLTVAGVRIRGLNEWSSTIQCATASAPVLSVSGSGLNGFEMSGMTVQHITNSPTCAGGAGSSTCGDGLQIAGGASRVIIQHNHFNFNYNNVTLGWTTYSQFNNNEMEFGNGDNLYFLMDSFHPVMQWQVQGGNAGQALGNGVNMTCPGSFTSVQTTGPTFTNNFIAYGNVGKGFKISCSAATTSGISDTLLRDITSSTNNDDAVYLDPGPAGGRNNIVDCTLCELTGQFNGTAGFAQATQSFTNVGYGINVTSSCDATTSPAISGEYWFNSYSGVYAACAGTQVGNIDTFGNGHAAASAQTEAGITSNAANVQITGGFFRKGSTQNYGIYVQGGDTPSVMGHVCDSSISAANCVFIAAQPTNGFQQWVGQTIHITGTGAPSMSAPEGSTYDRTDSPNGGKYTRTNGAWVLLGASGGTGLSGMTALGFPIPNSATTINSSTTPGTNQGTYLPQRVNTTQGTAATPTEAQVGIGGRAITGAATTDTVLYSDVNQVIDHDQGGSASVTETLPTATTLNNANFGFIYWNQSTHADTISATTWTIQANDAAGASTLTVNPGQACSLKPDPNLGTQWVAHCTDSAGFLNGLIVPTSAALLATNGSKQLTAVTAGTGVVTALGVNTGTAGAFGLVVASGTSAMGTGAITSGTCATVVTTTATGAATTDNLIANPTVDPTGVTGYAVSATGSLYIQAYITSGNVNFKVCNNTSGSLTPAALTMQWRVVR